MDPENHIKPSKRKIELLVLSDIHLGTYGCHAKELLNYLKSIKPKTVILNGDIIDMWQFNKRFWPKSHMLIIHHVIKWVSKGVKVYYIPGNHDEMLRKFSGFKMGSLEIRNKLLLDLDGKKVWIFHGDIFDVTMKHSRWLTRLGAHGYDLLILTNALVNWVSSFFGGEKISLSKKIKNGVKGAVSFIGNFEKTAAEIAIRNHYDAVICGHIHHPEMKDINSPEGKVRYLNSGDWVESLTSLEYNKGDWSLYQFKASDFQKDSHEDVAMDEVLILKNKKELFESVLLEFNAASEKTFTHSI